MGLLSILVILVLAFFFSLFFLALFLFPFTYTLFSFLTVFTIPSQLWRLAKSEKIRQNHALEHATINVLSEKYGFKHLAGLSFEDGFFIGGIFDPSLVELAARESLARLRGGEKSLVIHRECGTSAGVGNLISALVFIFLLLLTGRFYFFYIIISILLASILGSFFGKYAQKYLTTSSNLEGIEIKRVIFRMPQKLGFFPLHTPQIFVETTFSK